MKHFSALFSITFCVSGQCAYLHLMTIISTCFSIPILKEREKHNGRHSTTLYFNATYFVQCAQLDTLWSTVKESRAQSTRQDQDVFMRGTDVVFMGVIVVLFCINISKSNAYDQHSVLMNNNGLT